MLGIVRAGPHKFPFMSEHSVTTARTGSDRWQHLAKSTILVLGAPRSGTTWLAKIFDSHPDILYRHEPDELTPAVAELDPAEQLSVWLKQRGRRAAAKRPMFQKSWRPAPLDNARKLVSAALAVAQRTPALSGICSQIGVPDMVVPARWGSVRGAVKLVNWDASQVARAMPETRCMFLLRHPCGQAASVMAGYAKHQFESDTTEQAAQHDLMIAALWAERHGVDRQAFQALPEAARHAWRWRAFNEPAIEAMRDLPNTRIVVYEDLCRRPEDVARELFAFAGLDWHQRTSAFLGSSTQHHRPNGYYDVFRSSSVTAERWRSTMSTPDQDAVRAVIATSPLARFWPDLAAAPA